MPVGYVIWPQCDRADDECAQSELWRQDSDSAGTEQSDRRLF